MSHETTKLQRSCYLGDGEMLGDGDTPGTGEGLGEGLQQSSKTNFVDRQFTYMQALD